MNPDGLDQSAEPRDDDRVTRQRAQCDTTGCARPVRARGLCATCYAARRRAGPLPPLAESGVCDIADCDRRTYANLLCRKHYEEARRRADPERARAAHKSCRDRNREHLRERQRAAYAADPEKVLAAHRRWRTENRDRDLARRRATRRAKRERLAAVTTAAVSLVYACPECGQLHALPTSQLGREVEPPCRRGTIRVVTRIREDAA